MNIERVKEILRNEMNEDLQKIETDKAMELYHKASVSALKFALEILEINT